MDKFNIAQEINLLADSTLNSFIDTAKIKEKGRTICQYFKDNIEEITNNGRTAFHIGSAMYFYVNAISDEKDSQEYKFALLVASINLYKALDFRDVQSIVSAYRLHIALVHNPQFFNPIIMKLTNESVASMLTKSPEEVEKNVEKFVSYIEYCLFMYCQQDGAQMAWLGLYKEEKKDFEELYAKYKKKYKIDDFCNNTLFGIGNKWLNTLMNILIKETLQTYAFFGII